MYGVGSCIHGIDKNMQNLHQGIQSDQVYLDYELSKANILCSTIQVLKMWKINSPVVGVDVTAFEVGVKVVRSPIYGTTIIQVIHSTEGKWLNYIKFHSSINFPTFFQYDLCRKFYDTPIWLPFVLFFAMNACMKRWW